MIIAGLDIGSKYIKLVFIDEQKAIKCKKISLSGYEQSETADRMIEQLCEEIGIKKKDLGHIAVTGAGKRSINFVSNKVSEMISAAEAVHYLYPDARTIIEVGAESSKAIKIDKDGKIIDTSVNEKCAAGSGAFTESMARTLEMSLKDFAEKSLESDKKIPMNAQCTVFAESEVVSLIHSGVDKKDIAKAVHDAVANRVASMARRVRIEPEVVLIGGLVHNVGFVKSLKNNLELDNLILPTCPDFINAFGAAIFTLEKLRGVKC